MNAQTQTLPAPTLKQAENDTVYISRLDDPTEAVVPVVPDASVGDRVKLSLNRTHGAPWNSGVITITEHDVGMPIPFAIPKSAFAVGAVAGEQATLKYTFTRADSAPVDSLEARFNLQP
ncbi:hypothetical protein ACIP1Z_19545 [Pseudomonas moraviensis]|uniref:hypothetical protein n=1 Tax=Pseudomonas moraviensis TaxID=321662 RepID=UPI00381C16B7